MINCQFEDGHPAKLRHVTVDNIVLDNARKKILLARRGPKFSNPHKLAMPGGYMDRDEIIKETALREVREETGYEGKLIELFCIVDDPDRKGEDRQNITIIFITEAIKKVSEYDDEIEGIEWYDLNKLPDEDEFAFNHYQTVQLYLEYLEKPFPLPHFQSKSIS